MSWNQGAGHSHECTAVVHRLRYNLIWHYSYLFLVLPIYLLPVGRNEQQAHTACDCQFRGGRPTISVSSRLFFHEVKPAYTQLSPHDVREVSVQRPAYVFIKT
jgi:hypothetical protein